MKPLALNTACSIVRFILVLMAAFAIAIAAHAAVVSPLLAVPTLDLHSDNYTQVVLLHFVAGTTPQERDAVIAEMGGELVRWMHQIDVAEVRLPAHTGVAIASLPSAVSWAGDGVVRYAEADMLVSAAYVPGDPDFSDKTMSYGFQQIQALEAWDIVTGSQQIVIAVIDSGIKLEHPEFAGRLVAGYDFISNDEVADDDSGHGTHVAGVVAAALDNGEGVAGVCPNCRLMPVKVLNENNLGSWAQLASGILFAVDNGARILNLSLGATVSSRTLASAIDYALESGVIVVAAAGNFGSDEPFYPAALDGVIGVGATTSSGKRWARSDFGQYIDLVAPGELIYSTYHDLDNSYRGYTYMSGTSMAAPFVSGSAALLLSVAPTLDADDVVEALVLGVDDLGASGWDVDYGNGRVNVMGALMSPVDELVEAVGEIRNPSHDVVLYLPVLSHH